jgi:hypothetical protein
LLTTDGRGISQTPDGHSPFLASGSATVWAREFQRASQTRVPARRPSQIHEPEMMYRQIRAGKVEHDIAAPPSDGARSFSPSHPGPLAPHS